LQNFRSDKLKQKQVEISAEYIISQPLWQRVPTRTETGERTFDFMVIVKKLNQLDSVKQRFILKKIYPILETYSNVILLADLNLKINLLWVSHLPRPNLSFEIASQIMDAYPPARLISHRLE